MNHEEVKNRLNNAYTNVKRELSNVEELTGEDEGLDLQWTIFMTEHLEAIGKHGRDWLMGRYRSTKAAYEDSIKALEKHEKDIINDKGKLLKSKIESLQKDIEASKTRISKIEADIEVTKKVRSGLFEKRDDAIGRKDDTATDKAEKDLNDNKSKLDAQKIELLEAHRDANAKQRLLDMNYLQDLRKIIKDTKEHQKTLLEFEKMTKDLKMPVLGAPIAIHPAPTPKPGST